MDRNDTDFEPRKTRKARNINHGMHGMRLNLDHEKHERHEILTTPDSPFALQASTVALMSYGGTRRRDRQVRGRLQARNDTEIY